MAASLSHRDFRQAYRSKSAIKSHVSIVPQPGHGHPSLAKPGMDKFSLYHKVFVYQGSIIDDEITSSEIEAVVNPANERLWTHDAGVCGAIFRAAGYQQLQQACTAITNQTDDNAVPTGQTVLTPAFNIKNLDWILHAIAPCEQNTEDLESCYISVLELCVIANIRCVAFPCIGTGDAGFSNQAACLSALRVIHRWFVDASNVRYRDFMQKYERKQWHHNLEMEEFKMDEEHIYVEQDESVADRITSVVFCCFDSENMQLYQQHIPKIFEAPPQSKYSYLWRQRELLQQIRSQQMEHEKVPEEVKEEDAANILMEPAMLEESSNVLSNYLKQYKKICTKQRITSMIKETPQHLPLVKQELLSCSQHLQSIRDTAQSFIEEIDTMHAFVLQHAVPDTRRYKEWNADEIVMWLVSLDEGKFVPYIEQLRNGFVRSQTVGEDLPEFTRPDLSVPPFSIEHWKIKKELVTHFQSLRATNEEEGSADDQDDENHTTH